MDEAHTDSKQTLTATIKIFITTIIWASTFVLAQIAVEEIGPITLGGLRFFFAGLILVVYLRTQQFDFSTLKGHWWQLFALGILSFTIGNAASYFALQYIPSTTVSLMMSFITPIVLLFGIIWLKEMPGWLQYLGVGIALLGTVLYFHPSRIPVANSGFLVLLLGLFGFAGYNVLGRYVARGGKVHYLAQTAVPLLFGGAVLLVGGLIVEGLPVFSPRLIFIVIWLTLVNSILGYILYNQGIQHLTALKANVILNLSPFFTAIIAWILVGDKITRMQAGAMLVVFVGTFLVQTDPSKLFKK
jgi:drug/metabolite transporter (DMT)-like permease